MALTAEEEARVQDIEEQIVNLFRLLDGAGSRTRLDKHYIVFQNDLNKLEERMDEFSADLAELSARIRKLQ